MERIFLEPYVQPSSENSMEEFREQSFSDDSNNITRKVTEDLPSDEGEVLFAPEKRRLPLEKKLGEKITLPASPLRKILWDLATLIVILEEQEDSESYDHKIEPSIRAKKTLEVFHEITAKNILIPLVRMILARRQINIIRSSEEKSRNLENTNEDDE
jgi:hypothetical protein